MSANSILELLRQATRPIHQKLDQGGIGQKLKNNKFDYEDYRHWLLITLETNRMLKNEMAQFSTETPSPFIDADFGESELLSDIASEFGENLPMTSFKDPQHGTTSHFHNDLHLAIVYTFLGSSLGSQFIHRYINKEIPQASTHFLKKMCQQQENWTNFKTHLASYDLSVIESELGNYARYIFERILAIQNN